MAYTGGEEQWATSLTNEEQWTESLNNEEQWMTSLGEAVTRYVRLLLKTVNKVYHLETDYKAYTLRTKDKIFRLLTRKGGGI